MNANDIVTAISTVGFPIACCCFLLWQNSKQDEYHREEMEKLRDTISENTRIIDKLSKIVQRLADKMGVKEDD